MPAVSGLQDTFAGKVEWVVLDIDDRDLDGTRRRLGITAQAQYVLVNADEQIIGRWFGILNQANVAAEIESLIQT